MMNKARLINWHALAFVVFLVTATAIILAVGEIGIADPILPTEPVQGSGLPSWKTVLAAGVLSVIIGLVVPIVGETEGGKE